MHMNTKENSTTGIRSFSPLRATPAPHKGSFLRDGLIRQPIISFPDGVFPSLPKHLLITFLPHRLHSCPSGKAWHLSRLTILHVSHPSPAPSITINIHHTIVNIPYSSDKERGLPLIVHPFIPSSLNNKTGHSP